MTTKKLILLLSLIFLIALPASIAHTQTVETTLENIEPISQRAAHGGFLDTLERIREAQSQQLEGSWVITVTVAVPSGVPQPPPFIAHATFARGGGFFGTDRTRPFSKQHGTWMHLGGKDFAGTSTEDIFDAMGNFAGTVKVRVRSTMVGKDEFVGVSNGEFRDATGNITRNGCGTIRGVRIKVEPLPEHCQSITPPQ